MTDLDERIAVLEATAFFLPPANSLPEAMSVIRELKAERDAHKWQPIETAPTDGTKILVYTVHGEMEISEFFVLNHFTYEEIEGGLYKRVEHVTEGSWNSNHFEHWMPLPEGPKP